MLNIQQSSPSNQAYFMEQKEKKIQFYLISVVYDGSNFAG